MKYGNMKSKKIFIFICIILSTVTVSGCGGKNKIAKKEADNFVKTIEDAAKTNQMQQLNKPIEIKKITYDADNLRDPFSLPTETRNALLYPNTILRTESLDKLTLTGIIVEGNKKIAVFKNQQGNLYKLSEGMRIGLQNALLFKINENNVIFKLGSQGDEKGEQEITMTLQESTQ